MFHISVGLGIQKNIVMRDNIAYRLKCGVASGSVASATQFETARDTGLRQPKFMDENRPTHIDSATETANLSTRAAHSISQARQWAMKHTVDMFLLINCIRHQMVDLVLWCNLRRVPWILKSKSGNICSHFSVHFFFIISINHGINRWIVYDYTTSQWWIAELMRQNGWKKGVLICDW